MAADPFRPKRGIPRRNIATGLVEVNKKSTTAARFNIEENQIA
jgi:hypothetical protein